MRILVLGGTVFLGRAIARQALAAGHDVTCAARGSSGEPIDGVRFVRVDRDEPRGLDAIDGEFDTVVDVARRPSHVRHAVASLADRAGHLTFVSTCSVYADNSTPGQRVDNAPILEPAPPDADDPTVDAEAYGRCKVRCEQLVVDAFGADSVFLCRAGLIVGPEDRSGRFAYWASRSARGGKLLVPGAPDDLVQLIDVRDLADWIVDAAERRLAGTYDGIAPAITRAEFVEAIFDERTTPTYVSQEFLVEHEVEPWMGPRSIPLWLTLPEYAGFMSRDVTPSLAVGLQTRPLAETAQDTAVWLAGDSGPIIGLTDLEEREVLAAWHATR
jgi:2'-hydroxyisoflavone reductase